MPYKILLALILLGAPVYAEVPEEVATMLQDVGTDAADVVKVYVIPIVAIMCLAWALLRIGRKGGNLLG